MTRTLHVRIGSSPDGDEIEQRLAALDRGEDVEPSPTTLHLKSLDAFGRVFRATNLDLLSAIVEHEPGSIRELARIIDRHPPEVLDNLDELEDYGLVEFRQEGRAKRPVVPYDEIDVEGLVDLTKRAPA